MPLLRVDDRRHRLPSQFMDHPQCEWVQALSGSSRSFFFSAPPLTGPRRHASLTSGFSARFTSPQHLRCARAALAVWVYHFFRVMLVRVPVHGMQGPLEGQQTKTCLLPDLPTLLLIAFFQGLSRVPQIQVFNFISGPGGFSQKFQAGLDAWIIVKTPDPDDPSHFIPAIMCYQPSKNHFQSDAMKRIVALPVSHV